MKLLETEKKTLSKWIFCQYISNSNIIKEVIIFLLIPKDSEMTWNSTQTLRILGQMYAESPALKSQRS